MKNEKTDAYIDNYEDVSVFSLDSGREQLLHDKQTECVFMWTNSSGDPIGVVMNYVETVSYTHLTLPTIHHV